MLNVRIAVIVATMIAAGSAGAATFVMKKQAERDAQTIRELDRKIAAERQRISELAAEWSALDHPARLQVLVERHGEVLGLQPIRSEQVVSVSEIAAAARRRAEEAQAAAEEAAQVEAAEQEDAR